MDRPQTIIVKHDHGCLSAFLVMVAVVVALVFGTAIFGFMSGNKAIKKAKIIQAQQAKEKAESEAKAEAENPTE